MMRRVATSLVLVGLMGAGLVSVGGSAASAVPLTRPSDPVVMTASRFPTLVNTNRSLIVGFRWSGSAWQQFPIQIDERAVVSFGTIYNNPNAIFYGSRPGLVSRTVYTGSNTFTGADPNTSFDGDDELVFMARDSGVAAPAGSRPVGTAAGSGVRIRIIDPLAAGSEGFVYLFRSSPGSTLTQDAGKRYVGYQFRLLSGVYKTTYSLTAGPNPENSTVSGATYRRHFSDRWLSDEITITSPSSTKVDLLDRQKAMFSPGVCVRTEDTFDATGPFGSAEGAFIVNKNGPVRAIRSYIGANSGPNTQRTHLFYDRREDIRTDLRVHQISSVMDFMDYSPAATGMRYRNSLNTAGVIIDGNPDTLTSGLPTWEQITGPQGTVTHVGLLNASFVPGRTNYYLDDSTPPVTQCTGDAFAYGSSGEWINTTLPCTDPGLSCTATMTGTRVMFFDGPGGTAATAAAHRAHVVTPLQTTVATFT